MSVSTEWQIYERIFSALRAKDADSALRLIRETREDTGAIAGSIAHLEAVALEQLGENDRALKVLQRSMESNPATFWDHILISKIYLKMGRQEDSIVSNGRAHGLLGWQESERNGYRFLHDYFTINIPAWSKWFAEIITATPIKALEIGSWQGGSATWLLDKVIAPRCGELICVDTFEGSSEHARWVGTIAEKIEDTFDRNVAASGHSDLCRKIKGYSQDVLRALYQERFDFIYIDGAHEARYVIEDAVLAFGLLNDGGFLLFDDYNFQFSDRPRQNTSRAIDAFIDFYEDEVSLVDKGRQMLLQKAKPLR